MLLFCSVPADAQPLSVEMAKIQAAISEHATEGDPLGQPNAVVALPVTAGFELALTTHKPLILHLFYSGKLEEAPVHGDATNTMADSDLVDAVKTARTKCGQPSLVVLHGCYSPTIAARLNAEAGMPFIMGTTENNKNDVVSQFYKEFYSHLAGGTWLQTAFGFACLAADRGGLPQECRHRWPEEDELWSKHLRDLREIAASPTAGAVPDSASIKRNVGSSGLSSREEFTEVMDQAAADPTLGDALKDTLIPKRPR